MQHTITRRVFRGEYTAHSRNGERGAKSFRKHELLKSLETINPGPTRRGETSHNQDSPLTEGKGFRHWPKNIPLWKPETRQPRWKRKVSRDQRAFFNPVFLKMWNFYGHTFAPHFQLPSTFSSLGYCRRGRVELFRGLLRTFSFAIPFHKYFFIFFFILYLLRKSWETKETYDAWLLS